MPSPRVSVKCYLWFTVSFCLNTYHGGRFEIIYFTGMCITDARAHICSRLQPPSRRVSISFICPHADQIDIYCPKYFIERLHWSYFSALLCIYVYPLHFSGNICVQPALSAHFLHVYLKLWGRGEHFGAAGQPRGFTFANLDILSSCKLHLFLLSARIGVHAAGRCFLRLPAHSLIKGGWRVV